MDGTPIEPVSAAEPASLVARLEAVWERGRAAFVFDPQLLPAERPEVAPFAPNGTALVLATSGSTGTPKLVMLPHSAIAAAVALTNEAVGAERGDRWLCCLPAAHIAGLSTLLRARALGAEAVVHDRFDVERVAAEIEPRFVSVVPTMLRDLLDAGVDLSHYQRVLVGGARLADELRRRCLEAGVRLTVTYGMTETCGGVVYDGVPLRDVLVRLSDNARIELSSPTLMSGYLGDKTRSDLVLRDGWYLTEDRGEIDPAGRLRVLGRLDSAIVTGGNNVDPREVEATLRDHPQIADLLVRAQPDERWGELVVALVVPVDPRSPPGLEDLHRYLDGRLSRYKWPRSLTVVDRLTKPQT